MTPDRVTEVLNGKSAQDLLHSPLLMRLAYVGPDGYPRAIPIGYLWDGRSFVVCTAEAAPKVQALRSNPRVALTIDTEALPPHILLVRGRANVEIVEGVPLEYLDASRKAIGPDQWDAFEREVRRLYKRMARIRITPEWAKFIDFETTFPVAVQHLVSEPAQ